MLVPGMYDICHSPRHYLSYTFLIFLISQAIQKLLNIFCNYIKTQGEGRDLPLGLTASTQAGPGGL